MNMTGQYMQVLESDGITVDDTRAVLLENADGTSRVWIGRDNADYWATYQAWLAAGNKALPWSPITFQ
jgi:hypothetical protein